MRPSTRLGKQSVKELFLLLLIIQPMMANAPGSKRPRKHKLGKGEATNELTEKLWKCRRKVTN